jgi:hypothetical protein
MDSLDDILATANAASPDATDDARPAFLDKKPRRDLLDDILTTANRDDSSPAPESRPISNTGPDLVGQMTTAKDEVSVFAGPG